MAFTMTFLMPVIASTLSSARDTGADFTEGTRAGATGSVDGAASVAIENKHKPHVVMYPSS